MTQKHWLNLLGVLGLLSLVLVAVKTPEKAPKASRNPAVKESSDSAEKSPSEPQVLRATPTDYVLQDSITNGAQPNVTEWVYGGQSYVSVGELITVDQLEAADDEAKKELIVGKFIDVDNQQTSESSSPSISVGEYINVDKVSDPILPGAADDVVSIGEFIDAENFEPYQELTDSLFEGDLIQVNP